MLTHFITYNPTIKVIIKKGSFGPRHMRLSRFPLRVSARNPLAAGCPKLTSAGSFLKGSFIKCVHRFLVLYYLENATLATRFFLFSRQKEGILFRISDEILYHTTDEIHIHINHI